MKKIICILIVLLLTKDYKSECVKKNDHECEGGIESKTKCVFDTESSSCIEKFYCDKVEDPSTENCKDSITTSPTKNMHL